MNGQLISLIAVLAVLVSCPETPTKTAIDIAKTEAIAAKPAEAAAIRDAALVSAEHHD